MNAGQRTIVGLLVVLAAIEGMRMLQSTGGVAEAQGVAASTKLEGERTLVQINAVYVGPNTRLWKLWSDGTISYDLLHLESDYCDGYQICSTDPFLGDLDYDGHVSTSDLLILLGNWTDEPSW